jgi:cellulose synthase (UDP-forming)
MALDWPADKLRVYILDDGKREEVRTFAEEFGVDYITRPDNRHAKAGNLNHALAMTHGDLVAIFDCDHIPVNSFLRTAVGWFQRDPQCAMLQTPHHFFSPDPFERNLGTFRRVPNEGALFYGLIQDGNDFWNATFFCGSCAVLRRGPLMEVEGLPWKPSPKTPTPPSSCTGVATAPPISATSRPPAWPPKACPPTSASASAGHAAWPRSSG